MEIKKDVAISDLVVDFYVRRSLNEDRVLELALLIEEGVELPAILIDENRSVIDGRHRLEAFRMAGKTHISCETVKDLSQGEQILRALTENMGGSLPPSRGDVRLAIQNMITAGMKERAIVAGLPLPPSIVRKYLREATSNMSKAKFSAAIESVVDSGMQIKDAAEKYGIDLEDLRDKIRGKKKTIVEKSFGMPKVRAELSGRYRSSSQKNASMFTKLLDCYIDGDVSYKVTSEACDLAEKMILSQAQNVTGWRQRFAQAKKNQESTMFA